MKQRSTTPVSIKGIVTKSVIVASAVMMSVTSPIALYQQVSADRYDEQIKALQSEIDGYQAQAQALGNQARSLQDELKVLDGQKATIQAQIKISQNQYDQLQIQIKELQTKIAENKEILGNTLASMYADDKISPLEMLASSSNIGDFVDKQEYRTSMRDTLKTTIDQINKDKVVLEKKKVETERVLADQKSQHEALAAKEAERSKLLADTQGEEAAYQNLSSSRNAQVSQLRSQQAAELAARARRTSGGGAGGYSASSDGSNGGYPSRWANAPMDSLVDSWGMYNRECVSYAAFKVNQAYGNMPYWGGDRIVAGEFLSGHAKYWKRAAQLAGIPTGTSPRPGSVGVVTSGQYGHVAWVESVNPNGTINISHYNVGWNGQHAVWNNLSPSYFDAYVYFGG